MMAAPPTPRLTGRELDIFTLACELGSDKEAAAKLGLSWQSVRASNARLYRFLGVHTRTEALMFCVRQGLIKDPMSTTVDSQSGAPRS